MAVFSSLGVGSGLDLRKIVDGLVNAERVPKEKRLDAKEQSIKTELSALGLLKSSLSQLKGSIGSLKSDNTYVNKNVSLSSNETLSATADNDAVAGSYSVEVSALASKHSLASNAATAFSTLQDTVGSGTLTFKFGTTSSDPYSFTQDTSKATQTITVSAANNNTTLEGLREYINSNDYGVQAGIVNDGSGYRLTLTSENSGASNSMEITVSGDGDGDNNDNSGLSQLAHNTNAQGSATQTIAAQDAAISINGLAVTRDTNTITGAIEGVTLNLLKADVGNSVTVSVSNDTASLNSAIKGFVDGYNSYVSKVSSLTKYNSETKEAGALIGDYSVLSINRQLRSMVTGSISQPIGNIRSFIDIGITTKADGTLSSDSSKLADAIKNDPNGIRALFTRFAEPSDADVSYSKATDETQPGSYGVNITTMATQGSYSGSDITSLVIDGNNDNFYIKVNGTASKEIVLTQGSYANKDDLAAHLQAQIDDDENLKSANASVVVSYDSANNRFEITSAKYGAASKVELTSVDSNTSGDLGLSVAAGTTGVDVAGTINGQSASGNGQSLTSSSGGSKGLALLIASGTTGNRGEVSFSRGIADIIDGFINSQLSSEGVFNTRESGLQVSLKDIGEQRTTLAERVSKLETRLVKQFTTLDQLVTKYKSTGTYLEGQLARLLKPNTILNK